MGKVLTGCHCEEYRIALEEIRLATLKCHCNKAHKIAKEILNKFKEKNEKSN